MEQFSPKNENPFERFTKGSYVRLKKYKILSGKESKVTKGTEMKGVLEDNIKVGSPILLENGARTTSITDFKKKDGKFLIKTRTSVYELSLEDNNQFIGLELENKYGEVHTPENTRIAQLGNETTYIPLTDQDKEIPFYFNREKLQGILLEVNGSILFRVVHGRFMILAKVGDGHLPFYISSKGTSGKRAGDWYPFFGYNGMWLVKGSVDKETGDMNYSSTIKEIQDLLNENLRIPPMKYIFPSGKIGTNLDKKINEPTNIFVDLKKELNYYNPFFDEKEKEIWDDDPNYIRSITGYYPKHVKNDGGESVRSWINDIVKHLG